MDRSSLMGDSLGITFPVHSSRAAYDAVSRTPSDFGRRGFQRLSNEYTVSVVFFRRLSFPAPASSSFEN
eukprot:scaffold123199_cov17-Prasinocladus_malaysianus.AAC.1